jgi:DNA uptake protein ComE-like DNA-binding protein
MARPPERLSLSWTAADRRALTVLLAVAAAAVLWSAAGRRSVAGDPLGVDAAKVEAVRERIDPNTAEAASLRRVPGIGPVLAGRIVDVARRRRQAGVGRPFVHLEDLDDVPGIGPGILRRVEPWLALPRRPDPTADR